jgi:hypothetical protein
LHFVFSLFYFQANMAQQYISTINCPHCCKEIKMDLRISPAHLPPSPFPPKPLFVDLEKKDSKERETKLQTSIKSFVCAKAKCGVCKTEYVKNEPVCDCGIAERMQKAENLDVDTIIKIAKLYNQGTEQTQASSGSASAPCLSPTSPTSPPPLDPPYDPERVD